MKQKDNHRLIFLQEIFHRISVLLIERVEPQLPFTGSLTEGTRDLTLTFCVFGAPSPLEKKPRYWAARFLKAKALLKA